MTDHPALGGLVLDPAIVTIGERGPEVLDMYANGGAWVYPNDRIALDEDPSADS